jgi:hypothetical protein
LVGALVLSVAGACWLFASTKGGVEPLSKLLVTTASRATGGEPTFIHSPVCLIDADRDGVLDVVGLSAFQQNGPAIVLNGRTGAVMWSGGDYAFGSTLLCPDTHTFLIHESKSFSIVLRSADSLDRELSQRLSDEPKAWAFGAGCVAIETEDEQRHGVDLKTGAPVRCEAAPLQATWELQSAHLAQGRTRSWHAQRAGTHWRVWTRNPGTPVLSASATGRSTWSAELPYQSEHPAQLLTERTLVLLGFPIGRDAEEPHLLGLDAESGMLLYDRPLCSAHFYLASFTAVGRNVLIAVPATGVWLLDGADGHVLWHHGQC